MLSTILQHLIKHRFFGHSGGPSSAPPSPQGRKRRAATLIPATFSIVVGGGAAIDKLITVGSIIAAASEGISEAQSLITGQESHATKFERGVQQLLIEGGWNGTTWRVDAAFGVFGSLPLVGVTFDDAFVLVDTVNGNVDGPFTLTSTLDSRPLLEVHVSAYTLGTTIRHLSTLGCITTARARWRTDVPPGGPFVPRPGSPNTPTPPYIIPGYGPGGPQLHPENPGWFTDWQCFTKIDGFNHSCECYAYGKYDNTSTGSSYWVRIKCVLNGGCTLLPGGLPELTTPFVPITNPLVPQGPPFPQPDPSISPATWNCNVPAGPYTGTEWYY